MLDKKLLLTSLFFILIFSFSSFAQQNIENQDSQDQTNRTENYTLDIKDKKITEENYEADVRVTNKSTTKKAVLIDVGVGVRAKKITVTLTNVTGDVKFKGSLDKLLETLKLEKIEKVTTDQKNDN